VRGELTDDRIQVAAADFGVLRDVFPSDQQVAGGGAGFLGTGLAVPDSARARTSPPSPAGRTCQPPACHDLVSQKLSGAATTASVVAPQACSAR
jgi:hypothetical protein